MAAGRRQIALLKVLAAAAWADGRLDRDEVNHLKDLMLAYRLDAADLVEIDALLAAPVGADRCREYTRELLAMLDGDAARREVLEEVERLLRADGRFEEEERQLLENLQGVMDSLTAVDGFLSRITGVFRRVFAGRDAGAPELESYAKNPALRRVHELSGGSWRESADARRLNTVTLFAAVLARVAFAEDGVAPDERRELRRAAARTFDLEEPLLDWVVTAAIETVAPQDDRQALLSEFNRVAEMPLRLLLLDAAFAVAAGDGEAGEAELEELRLISNYLWIDPRDFHEIRRRRLRGLSGGA